MAHLSLNYKSEIRDQNISQVYFKYISQHQNKRQTEKQMECLKYWGCDDMAKWQCHSCAEDIEFKFAWLHSKQLTVNTRIGSVLVHFIIANVLLVNHRIDNADIMSVTTASEFNISLHGCSSIRKLYSSTPLWKRMWRTSDVSPVAAAFRIKCTQVRTKNKEPRYSYWYWYNTKVLECRPYDFYFVHRYT